METVAAAVRRVERQGQDLDEAVELYEHVYNSGDIHIGRAAEEGFRYRYRLTADDHLAVGSSSVDAHRWGTIEPDHHYSVAWAVNPGMLIDTRGVPFELQVGVPAMYPEREFGFDLQSGGHHFVRFEGDFLEEVAAARRGEAAGPLVLTRTPDPEAIARLRAVLLDAAPGLFDVGTEGSVRAMLDTTVAEAVIDVFDAAPRSGHVAAGRITMRLAQEYLVEHAAEPLTMTQVAREIGVGARTLQAAFRQFSDTTPLRFLRDVRLHRVRAMLRDGDPRTTSVADAAGAWGFHHAGRFAAAYVAAYGERPSDTLRR